MAARSPLLHGSASLPHAPLSRSRNALQPSPSAPPIPVQTDSATHHYQPSASYISFSNQSHHQQECHQAKMRPNNLPICESLTSDGTEHHVILLPPFQKSLLHNACCFSYYCALQFGCKVLGVVAGLEPAHNGVNDISSLYALPLSYTTHHIYLSIIQAAGSHTSLRQQPQSPSALLDLQSGFRISIRSICCDCVATIRPSILTTSLGLTLLPIRMLRHRRNQMP